MPKWDAYRPQSQQFSLEFFVLEHLYVIHHHHHHQLRVFVTYMLFQFSK